MSDGVTRVKGATKVKAAISELVTAFPAAFTLDPMLVRPFKLGIKDDLYLQSDISHRRITAALRAYCNSVHYLKATTEGAVRIDLAGVAAGTVTATEAHHAKEGFAALPKARTKGTSKIARSPTGLKAPKTGRTDRQSRPLNSAAPKSGEISKSAPPTASATPGPKRLSLSDLRRAAVTRKAK
jgi:ProP effector